MNTKQTRFQRYSSISMLLIFALSLANVGCSLSASAHSSSADNQDDKNEQLLSGLQGTWVIKEWQTARKNFTAEDGKQVTIKGDTIDYPFMGRRSVWRIEFVESDDREPSALNLHGEADIDGDGNVDFETMRKCLYVDGDRLMIALGTMDTDFNMEFNDDGSTKVTGSSSSDRPGQLEPTGRFTLLVLERPRQN